MNTLIPSTGENRAGGEGREGVPNWRTSTNGFQAG